jgi:hypothetical protein
MEKADGLVNDQVIQKMLTNTLTQVDNVLAYNVIDQHYSLLRVNPGSLQCLK